MFFGMCNSPGSFQRFMNAILEPWYKKYGREDRQNYMDDIGIGTTLKDKEKHLAIIHNLFDILVAHRLHLKLSKSTFLQPEMDFLGVWVNKHGIMIDPAKVVGLRDYPRTLKNLKQVWGFLGVASYHHMFVPDFSTIAAPLTRLTCKDVPFL